MDGESIEVFHSEYVATLSKKPRKTLFVVAFLLFLFILLIAGTYFISQSFRLPGEKNISTHTNTQGST